jgi:hypothetical protein
LSEDFNELPPFDLHHVHLFDPSQPLTTEPDTISELSIAGNEEEIDRAALEVTSVALTMRLTT